MSNVVRSDGSVHRGFETSNAICVSYTLAGPADRMNVARVYWYLHLVTIDY